MRSIGVIARNTITEALGRIILQIILVFALLFLVVGFFFTYMTPGEEDKMLKDMGLTVISVFGLLTAIYMGVSLVQPEVERRTIYAVLAKPVRRFEFVLGKYFGALVVLLVAMVVMGVVLMGALYVKEHTWSPQLLMALFGTYFALVIMTALVMMISTFSSQLMAILGGFVFWAIGYSQSYIDQLAKHADTQISRYVLLVIGTVLPNFTRLDIRTPVVDGSQIPVLLLGLMAGYGIIYTIVIMAIAMILFYEREF